MSASATIFISSSGSSAFIPVIAEMKNPRDYRKAVYVCMVVVNAAYLSFGLVVYRWCGQWVASPSLGLSTGVFCFHGGIGIESVGEMEDTNRRIVSRPNHQNGSIRHRHDRSHRIRGSLPPHRSQIYLRPHPA